MQSAPRGDRQLICRGAAPRRDGSPVIYAGRTAASRDADAALRPVAVIVARARAAHAQTAAEGFAGAGADGWTGNGGEGEL